MKNSNDTIGNRTRDLPACSAVPQPTVSRRVSKKTLRLREISGPKREDERFLKELTVCVCVCGGVLLSKGERE